jgi:hypothetical protein
MHASLKEAKESGISLVQVNNEKEMLQFNVDGLAQQLFKENAQRVFPTFLIFDHGKLCGYFQATQRAVIVPALHPDTLTPHRFVTISRTLVTEVKRLCGNPLFLLCDKAGELGEERLKMIRLKKAKETAYVYSEED